MLPDETIPALAREDAPVLQALIGWPEGSTYVPRPFVPYVEEPLPPDTEGTRPRVRWNVRVVCKDPCTIRRYRFPKVRRFRSLREAEKYVSRASKYKLPVEILLGALSKEEKEVTNGQRSY